MSGDLLTGTSTSATVVRTLGLGVWAGLAALSMQGWGPQNALMLAFSRSVFLAVPLLYFLPAMEAGLRDHQSRTSIILVNLLLGWTLVGWVVAIAWACTSKPTPPVPAPAPYVPPAPPPPRPAPVAPTPPSPAPGPAASVADELAKLAALKESGVLTADEFAAQKAKLLA